MAFGRGIAGCGSAAAIGVLAVTLSAHPAAAEWYLRAGLGFDWSRDADFRDRNCAAVQPPALFGCGRGQDGRPLGARGDFGESLSYELAVGLRALDFLRLEAGVSYRPEARYTGEANFLGVQGPQPVAAKLDSLTGLLVGYIDLPGLGMATPFLGGGIGATRHDISPVTYRFPGLGAEASTVIQGGTTTSFSYMLAGGAALPLSERLTLDVGYRYLDLGKVKTEPGPATITRRTFSRSLDIAGTEKDFRSHGLSATVRLGF